MLSIFCYIFFVNFKNGRRERSLLNQKIILKYNYTPNSDFNESEQILSYQLLLVIENLVENLNIICQDEIDQLFIDKTSPTESVN